MVDDEKERMWMWVRVKEQGGRKWKRSLSLSAVGNESKERERGWLERNGKIRKEGSGNGIGRIREWNGKDQGMEWVWEGKVSGRIAGRKEGRGKVSLPAPAFFPHFFLPHSLSPLLTLSFFLVKPAASFSFWLPPQFLLKSRSLGWKKWLLQL